MNKNEKIKRVAFFESRFDSFYGAQQSMLTLMSNLDSNHEVIAVTTKEGDLSENLRQAGIKTEIIPISPLANVFGQQILNYSWIQKFKVILGLLKYNFIVMRWIKKQHIDIVYANDARTVMYVGPAARLQGIPVIWYVRGDERTFMHRIAIRLASKIITIADGVRKAFKPNELNRFYNKFVTLYTGFNTSLYHTLKKSNELKVDYNISLRAKAVGLVGSITPRKGHDLMVEAAHQLNETDYHFFFFGDVPDGYQSFEIDLKRKIKELNLENRFHWVGFVDDIPWVYRNIDLLVLPSRSEGLPRVLIEGLASGLPIVASDVGGVREIIVNNELGRICKQDDSSSLASAIGQAFSEEQDHYKQKRKAYVQNKFSIESYKDKFTAILDHL